MAGAMTQRETNDATPATNSGTRAPVANSGTHAPARAATERTTYAYNYGHVEVNEEERYYVGATGKTNNAGELTAVLYAMRKGLTEPDDVAFTLYTDSMLALKAATFAGARRRKRHSKRSTAELTRRVQAAAQSRPSRS